MATDNIDEIMMQKLDQIRKLSTRIKSDFDELFALINDLDPPTDETKDIQRSLGI